jgi:hypothetical protein
MNLDATSRQNTMGWIYDSRSLQVRRLASFQLAVDGATARFR